MQHMDERMTLIFSIRMALRSVPAGILRELGKRRLPGDDWPERVIAEAILEHLERSNYRITHGPPAMPGRTP